MLVEHSERGEAMGKTTGRWTLALAAGLLLGGTAAAQGASDEAYEYFARNCVSCHTIGGGPLAGPDLAGLLDRRDRDWLSAFLLDPAGVIDSGDVYAQALLRDARGVYMPTPPGITADLADKLLTVIAVEDGLDKSRFAGLQLSDRPLTPVDIALGRQLFNGTTAFASGSPACFACHTVEGAAGFGGGRLGLDLTTVYARMEGRKALGAWLGAPPSPVMAPLFQDAPLDADEILALTAYLKHTSESGVEQASSGVLAFLLTGLGLAAVLLVLFDVAWKDRYRSTRRTLVEGRRSPRLASRAVEGMEGTP